MTWLQIDEFPGYSVSDEGLVRNDDSDHIMAMTANQSGVAQVGLSRDGVQYRRSLALLVANTFLPPPKSEAFNTPINLDGNRFHNAVENLVWRPRWFAVLYHQQFHNGKRGFREPVIDTKTGEWFPDSWAAATKYGLLDREIMVATLNRTYVWPTYQRFQLVD